MLTAFRKQKRSRRPERARLWLEVLETRVLLSASPGHRSEHDRHKAHEPGFVDVKVEKNSSRDKHKDGRDQRHKPKSDARVHLDNPPPATKTSGNTPAPPPQPPLFPTPGAGAGSPPASEPLPILADPSPPLIGGGNEEVSTTPSPGGSSQTVFSPLADVPPSPANEAVFASLSGANWAESRERSIADVAEARFGDRAMQDRIAPRSLDVPAEAAEPEDDESVAEYVELSFVSEEVLDDENAESDDHQEPSDEVDQPARDSRNEARVVRRFDFEFYPNEEEATAILEAVANAIRDGMIELSHDGNPLTIAVSELAEGPGFESLGILDFHGSAPRIQAFEMASPARVNLASLPDDAAQAAKID